MEVKYRQNYSFNSTSAASFFTKFTWHEVRQEFHSEKTRVFPFSSHFKRWIYPKVPLLACDFVHKTPGCEQTLLLCLWGKKSVPRRQKKNHSENWKTVLKPGENAVVRLMLFSFLAPLQDVVLAQVQLQVGDNQELWIKHTKCTFSHWALKVFSVFQGETGFFFKTARIYSSILFIYLFIFTFVFLSLQTQSLTSTDLGVWLWLSDPFLHPQALFRAEVPFISKIKKILKVGYAAIQPFIWFFSIQKESQRILRDIFLPVTSPRLQGSC